VTGFPPSDLPFVLLAGAVLVDLAVAWSVPGLLAAVPVTAGVYGVGALQEAAGMLPPWNWWSAIPAGALFALLWAGIDTVERGRRPAGRRGPVEAAQAADASDPEALATGASGAEAPGRTVT
jgi:hypothetical protein